MNDRILELAKEASINCVVPTDGTLEFTDKGDIEHLKKFAELIVRECVGLIRQQSIGEEVLGGQRYKTIQLGETIATITEHFGVEE